MILDKIVAKGARLVERRSLAAVCMHATISGRGGCVD